MNKVILYIATSLDGFIADSKGGVDWLPSPNELPNDLEDILGFKALMQRIGAIVMGSHSYQQILTFGPWAWPDKRTEEKEKPLTKNNIKQHVGFKNFFMFFYPFLIFPISL